MEECYALAIRFEDQQWYKTIMFRVKLEKFAERMVLISGQMIDAFKRITDALTQAWQEVELIVVDELTPHLNMAFKDVEITLEELSELFEKLEVKEERKIWVPYNPPRENAWYNQYQKKMLRDKRSEMKHFTIYRRE